MSKLFLPNILLLVQVVPPFEQTLTTYTQGLFVCKIKEFCSVVSEKKIFKILHYINCVQIVFGYYFADNVDGATI